MLIRKETVRTIIALANAAGGGHISSNDRHLLETAKNSIGDSLDWRDVYDRYVRRLSQQEVAELMVLRLLGKDQSRSPDQWSDLVAKASKLALVTLYDVPVERLPQYLRGGMERLARQRFKKSKDDPALEERRVALIGRCFLEIYREKYGQDSGMKALGEYLNRRGYLDSADDKALFNLSPKASSDEPKVIKLDSTFG